MTEIPADVMKQALDETAKVSLFGTPNPGWAGIIARAILAERERCGKIAHEWMHENGLGSNAADVALAIQGYK